MTTISGPIGISPTTIGLAPGAGLDGDTLLAYCTAQMNGLNLNIKNQMKSQSANREAKESLTKVHGDLAQAAERGGLQTPEQRQGILTGYRDALMKLPPGPARDAVLRELNEFRRTACYDDTAKDITNTPDGLAAWAASGINDDLATQFHAEGKGTNFMNAEECKKMGERLQETNGDIGKNAELDMIGLQQLISQRQMAIQMTTNLMTKINQSYEAIVGNTGK